METLEKVFYITLLAIIILVPFVIFLFFLFKKIIQIREQQKDQKINLDSIIKTINKLEEFGRIHDKNWTEESSKLSDEIKIINQVFTSNYKRGEFGEISLKWVLEECFNENEDIVIPQYTMKNGNRPDYFLKTNNGGIPIDSKFPYDNFKKIINLKQNSKEYKNEMIVLKKHLKNHINDVSSKYITEKENVEQAFLYLPSETLFSFIHSKRDLSSIRKHALDKKVILTSSSNLPAALRLIALFERDKKLHKNLRMIINAFKQILKESKKVKEHWVKIDKKIETIVEEKRKFNTSIENLNQKIEETVNSKIKLTVLNDKKEEAKN